MRSSARRRPLPRSPGGLNVAPRACEPGLAGVARDSLGAADLPRVIPRRAVVTLSEEGRMHRPVVALAFSAALVLLGGSLGTSAAQTAKPEAKGSGKKAVEPATRVPTPTPMPPGKPGGTLNVMLREDLPQGFAIHETATISTVFPSS